MFISDLKKNQSYNDFYFVKYGRGGVIVYLENQDLKGKAEHFHKKDDINSALGYSCLHPIKNIEVKNDELLVQFSIHGALISRTVDKSQVTLEVFNVQNEA